MSKKKEKNQFKEILWNLVNSLLAGVLVLLGAVSNGKPTADSFLIAGIMGGIVAITQFKNYWDSEKQEYTTKCFNFVGA